MFKNLTDFSLPLNRSSIILLMSLLPHSGFGMFYNVEKQIKWGTQDIEAKIVEERIQSSKDLSATSICCCLKACAGLYLFGAGTALYLVSSDPSYLLLSAVGGGMATLDGCSMALLAYCDARQQRTYKEKIARGEYRARTAEDILRRKISNY